MVPAVPVHDPPVVVNTTFSISEDTVLSVSAADGVLKGAYDVEGDPLVVFNNTRPANGSVTVQRNGSFVYVPNKDYNGVDLFEFTASDGAGGFAKGVVNITIGELL